MGEEEGWWRRRRGGGEEVGEGEEEGVGEETGLWAGVVCNGPPRPPLQAGLYNGGLLLYNVRNTDHDFLLDSRYMIAGPIGYLKAQVIDLVIIRLLGG